MAMPKFLTETNCEDNIKKRKNLSTESSNLSQKTWEDVALVALLKTCAKHKNLPKAIQIHDDILKRGLLKNNIFIGNTLINLYAKCGALSQAKQVFNDLPIRDVISWNALLTGYAQHGHGEKALDCFKAMQRAGLSPDAVTYSCVIKACGSTGAVGKGKEVHTEIAANGLLGKDVVLGNALIDMYAKCGALDQAQKVFNELPDPNVISWNALIGGYCQHGQEEEAIDCFERMQHKGFDPNEVTFTCILSACSALRAAEKGKAIHGEIDRRKLLGNSVVLGSALVNMYAKTDDFAKAQEVLHSLPMHSVVSWTALISGYCEQDLVEQAFECYKQMKEDGFSPDAVTFSCILKACGSRREADKGKKIHVEAERKGLVAECAVVGNAVVDMYGKCGALVKAQEVFDGLPAKDVVSWNALIAGYCQHDYGEEALHCHESMKCEGVSPDDVTLSCILKACGAVGAVEKGVELHASSVTKELLRDCIVVGNALVDMYAKCGKILKAQEVFKDLPMQDAASWNTLLVGYGEHELSTEALQCFDHMKYKGFSPDAVTLSSTLKTCGSIGASVKGRDIHAEIIRWGWLGGDNAVLGNALVDMYAKCGVLGKARQVFDELSSRDTISWNALIAGCCEHGHGKEAFDHFEGMKCGGLSPDAATFACILKACASLGAADKGQMYFEAISSQMLNLEHYTCMVDLFARSGRLENAVMMITKMPSSDYLPAWLALLSASRKWVNVEVGRLAFENAVRLDRKAALAYVYMRDIYASAGMQEDVDRIDALRSKNEACMEPRPS